MSFKIRSHLFGLHMTEHGDLLLNRVIKRSATAAHDLYILKKSKKQKNGTSVAPELKWTLHVFGMYAENQPTRSGDSPSPLSSLTLFCVGLVFCSPVALG